MNFMNRKIFFIEKKLQTKYILLTIFLLIIYTLIFVIIIFVPYMLTLYFDYPLAEKTEAAKALLILHGAVWPGIGVMILLFSALSIFITHKIAGPLFRMKKDISQVMQGNLNVVVKLRKKDDLKDLAGKVNMLIEELRTFVTASRNAYDLLSDHIQELEQKIGKKVLTEESGREIINKLQAGRNNIEAALKKFNIK